MASVSTTRSLCPSALALSSSSSRQGALHSSLSGNAFPRPSSGAAKAGVRCQASESDEVALNRREIVVGLSASVLAAGVLTLSPATQEAQAADLIQRSQRAAFLSSLKDKLRDEIKAQPELVPGLLRLALNDAMTYDKASKTGGANGSVRAELTRPENKGLEKAISFLEDLKKRTDEGAKGGPISWADLIHVAAQSAVKRTFLQAAARKCGGDEKRGDQLYTAYGSSGQWGQFDKLLGRAEASEADPEGRVPVWETASTTEIKEKFAPLGFKPRQITVLSAFFGDDQAATEAKFAADPEFAPWVKKYQDSRETISQTDYEVDLITAFTKLSVFGQTINYEAYTYKPKANLRF